ncbi:hypothetical protein EMCRGX_G004997 [Ephydatia muelleri]
MDSNEENQEAIDSMHVFEAERGDDMYTSGASDDASELSRPVSENDSDSEEEYSHSSSSEQEEEPMSCTLNMESIPESSFEPLYNGSTVTVCGNWTELEAHKPHTEHDTIDDIWSGDTLCKDADLQTNSFLALGISTDGVALFKSSKTSLWPVYLLIQNLPPQVRFKGENIILCGIWQGSRKPDMNVLLKPVVKSIQQLKEHGVIIQTPIGPKLYHAKLVLGIFDAPAKASVLCEKQFNGEFGCPTCLHPGKRIQNGARVYLPKKYPIRTHKDLIDDGMEALRTGTAINGVRKLLPREVRYSTVEKECLAIKLGMETFRVYLLGRKFTVETDHRSLSTTSELTPLYDQQAHTTLRPVNSHHSTTSDLILPLYDQRTYTTLQHCKLTPLCNLSTYPQHAYTNPNNELGKEITAGWIINDHINVMKAKIDLKAAFHLIPVRAVDWVHLGMDRTCLPFGLRSALSLINNYADALHWIMTSNCGAQLLHYLDDFLLVGPSWQRHLSGGHVQNARCWCVTSWASQWPLRS